MLQAGYGPDNPLRLAFETFDEPNNKRVAAVFQAMLHDIWVYIDIVAIDASVHGRNMITGNYDLGAASWFADFNDASNFLDLLRSDAGNNYGGYRNPAFDRHAERRPAGARRRAARPASCRRGADRAQGLSVDPAQVPHHPGPRSALCKGLGGQ